MNKSIIIIVFVFLNFLTQAQEYTRLPINTTDGSIFNLVTGYAEPKVLGAGGSLPTAFHEGIDVYRNEGNYVYAARSGFVHTTVQTGGSSPLNFIAIKAPIVENPDWNNTEHWEYDIYLHVMTRYIYDINNPERDTFVNASTSGNWIGKTDSGDHIHFARLKYWSDYYTDLNFNIYGYSLGAANSLNPLAIMPNLQEYDARDFPCSGSNMHTPPYLSSYYGNNVDFYSNNSTTNQLNANKLYGDIDIIVTAIDDLYNSGFDEDNKGVSLYSLGYWIENISGTGENVGSSIEYYKLFEYNDNYFFNWNFQDTLNTESLKFQKIVLFNPSLYNYANMNYPKYTATNTFGNDGSAYNLDSNQCWATRAFNSVTSSNGYCVSCNPVFWPLNAKFYDGEYVIHIIIEDVVNTAVEDSSTNVILDNFPPYIHSLDMNLIEDKSQPFYSYSWDINQNNMLASSGESSVIPLGSEVRAVAFFSEPVTEFTFSIPEIGVYQEFTYTTPVMEQIIEFPVNLPAKSTSNQLKIEMTCTDLAGNSNYSLGDINNTYQPAYRTGNNPNDWNISSFQGVDTCHVLQIGTGNIEVPSASFPTIQSAIDYVWDNNLQDVTVNVQPGTYNENINFRGLTNFSLIGDEQNPASTIIDGGGNTVVVFNSSEIDSTTVMSGFTIQNGARGILCVESSPCLLHLIIENNGFNSKNNKDSNFGGISLESSNSTIKNVVIRNNNTSDYWGFGGGMSITNYSNILVENTIIENNTAFIGGGVEIDSSVVIFNNVTIQNNTALNYAGGVYFNCNLIKNNDLQINNNSSPIGAGLYLETGIYGEYKNILLFANNSEGIYNNMDFALFENITIHDNEVGFYNRGFETQLQNCIIYENDTCDISTITFLSIDYTNFGSTICDDDEYITFGNENISSDPQFTTSKNNNYYLAQTSPCINKGNPEIIYQDDDQTRNDMGACRNNITGFITADTNFCENSEVNFMIDACPDYDFLWNFPSSWEILSGAGTNSVLVKVGNQSEDVSVTISGNNQVVNSEPHATNVDLLPYTNSNIEGDQVPCVGHKYDYSISPIVNAEEYNWNVPSNWEITGFDENRLTVIIGSQSGHVTVYGTNECGNSETKNLYVNPGYVISGPTRVSYGVKSVEYQIRTDVIGEDSFIWTIPEDWYIISGQGTNKIKVHPGTSSGFVSVKYKNDFTVPHNTYCPLWVDVLLRDKENEKQPEDLFSMNIYPNPTNGKFEIRLNNEENISGKIELYNTTGQKIKTLVSEKTYEANSRLSFEYSELTPGVYIVRFVGNRHNTEKILIIEK